MTDSLRDQLLGLGFKPAARPEPEPGRRQGPRKPGPPQPRQPRAGRLAPAAATPVRNKAGTGKQRAARSREDIDLAKAYAIRAQKEKDERIQAEHARQEQARQRREAKARLGELLRGKTLNDPAAEIARHFEYGGKIKRIYVTQAQLAALNAGELGVVQLDGRYLLVAAALLAEVEAVFAPAVALRIDPSMPAQDDPYADPRYQVPDDLVW